MGCALWGAAHVIEFVRNFKFRVFIRRHKFVQKVWVDVLSVQVPKNHFKCLLGAPHVPF